MKENNDKKKNTTAKSKTSSNKKSTIKANQKKPTAAKTASTSDSNKKKTTAKKKESTSKTGKTTSKNASNKPASKKKSSDKKSTSSKNKTAISDTKQKKVTSTLRKEVIGVLTIAFSIFLIFSLNLDDSMGIFGDAIRTFSYILLGRGMYIVSFVFLLVGVLHLINYVYYSEKKQNLAVAGIFLCCLIFICMHDITNKAIFTANSEFKTVIDFSINYTSKNVFGGGILGNILSWGNIKLFGNIGTYIIFSSLMLVFIIIFTNQSLIGFFKMIWRFILKIINAVSNFIFIEEDVEDDEEDEIEINNEKSSQHIEDNKKNIHKSKKSKQDKLSANAKKKNTINTVNTAINTANDIDLFEFEGVKVDLKEKNKEKKAKEITQLEIDDDLINESKKSKKRMDFIDNDNNSPYINDKILKKHPVNEDIIIKDYQTSYQDSNINFFGGKIDNTNVEDNNNIDKDKTVSDSIIHNKAITEQKNMPKDIPNISKFKRNNNDNTDNICSKKVDSNNSDIQLDDQPPEYIFPKVNLLDNPKANTVNIKEDLRHDAEKLIQTLKTFGVDSKLLQISRGPTITRYELAPAPGIKVSKITSLCDDIALSLAAQDVRIEAPIPGKSAVGIEIPNKVKSPVVLKSLLTSKEYDDSSSNVPFAIGQDISGKNIVADIAKMPHLLIAGATGSGKSVCINTLIMSILYKAHPVDVKLILIDPKVVELSVYNGIPHLLIPVVTDPRKASNALSWAVNEMDNRYKLFAQNSVRDIHTFNKKMIKENNEREKMSQIVIIIDELADLMQVASKEVEDSITRIAQLARACGIHLVIATQRPSVDVITGTIKANIPSRIAFAVSSYIDSRTILDASGAEKLLGKGDMFYHPMGDSKATRIQCSFVSDDEIKRVVDFISSQKVQTNVLPKAEVTKEPEKATNVDEYLESAILMAVERETISASMLQRSLPIGFNRAAKLLDSMEERGVISGPNGYKPRKVLVTKEELGIEN